MMTRLPAGWRSRAATEADLPALATLDVAHTKTAVGRSLRTENEIRIEWKSPTFNLRTDSQIVLNPQGAIVGWCEVYDFAPHTRIPSRMRLDPALLEDDSVATWLIDWALSRARQSVDKAPAGARVIHTQGAYQALPQLIAKLERAGFSYARSFLRMNIKMSELPAVPTWPEGIVVRPMIAGEDDRAAVAAIRDAFQDHWGYVETPFDEDLEEWKQWIHEDEDFDTDLWFLAMDGDEIAGFCQCYPLVGDDPTVGLVDELGVRKPWRGRGIAFALLQHAFRAFYQRGKRIVELGVDSQSPTGATRLYDKAGMTPVWALNVYELKLRAEGDSS